MLLCHECHDEVDKKNPHLYSRESLEEMKGEHEARIRLVSDDVCTFSFVIRRSSSQNSPQF